MAENTTLSRPYAKAIYNIATQTNSVSAWSEKLASLAAIAKNETMASIIGDPSIDEEKIVSIFQEVAKDIMDEQTLNLVKLAVSNKRASILDNVCHSYEKIVAEQTGNIEAEVISAFSVTAPQKKTIVDALKKRLNKDVTVTTSVDKTLVGGIVIKVGDLVIDGSVTNQLEKITKTLTR